MRTLWTTAVIFGLVTVAAAAAQGLDDQLLAPLPSRAIPLIEQVRAPELSPSDPAGREQELAEWIEEFSEWKKWSEQWGNRREPGWFSEFRNRRQRPDPPLWLFDRCEGSHDDTGTMADACTLLAEWTSDTGAAQIASARVAASAQQEQDDKTMWWEHLHLDVGWPALQAGNTIYGVVGLHATTSVRDRLQIFVAPGAMLLNVPTRDGARAWKLATNYGIAYRLGQIALPGNRRALLHLNLAKAWLLSAGDDIPTKSTDFIGFSMTFKKRP